jgi:hypothetical protein
MFTSDKPRKRLQSSVSFEASSASYFRKLSARVRKRSAKFCNSISLKLREILRRLQPLQLSAYVCNYLKTSRLQRLQHPKGCRRADMQTRKFKRRPHPGKIAKEGLITTNLIARVRAQGFGRAKLLPPQLPQNNFVHFPQSIRSPAAGDQPLGAQKQ